MEISAITDQGINPLSLLFIVTMAVLAWRLPRRYAVVPLLITVCYMPLGQQVVIAGLHFQFIRILLFVGWIRIFSRGELSDLRISRLDKLFIYWALATLILGTLASPSLERFINRAGEVYNALGTYFLIRCWVRSLDDTVGLVRFLGWMIVPMAVSMIVEKFTTHNIFSVFGGVPAITLAREGKLRCQGAFRHPILAGTYGATAFPLLVGLWFLKGKENRRSALIGGISAMIITVAAASSGAVLALMATMAGLVSWRVRDKMRLIRRGVVVAIVAMALLMNAPVWFSIARLSEIAGGTGWYRSYLIDQAVKHFNEWWLVGSTYTAHWAPAGEVVPSDPNNMDIINHYVAEGLGGGLLKLGLFIAMIVLCFKTVGRLAKHSEALEPSSRMFVWSLGVCLFGHCVSFFSVSYFDQIIVMWYWLLATISMLLETREAQLLASNTQIHASEDQRADLAGSDSGREDRLDAVV